MSSLHIIHGWKCHQWKSAIETCYPWMNVSSVDVIHGWRNVIHGWRSVIRGCHPWMEKCHPWMKVSSVDVIHGWRNVIRWCHPRKEVTDNGHGQGKRCAGEAGWIVGPVLLMLILPQLKSLSWKILSGRTKFMQTMSMVYDNIWSLGKSNFILKCLNLKHSS